MHLILYTGEFPYFYTGPGVMCFAFSFLYNLLWIFLSFSSFEMGDCLLELQINERRHNLGLDLFTSSINHIY